jgi:RimJ/RimL family protein N-acetyltransferase
MKLLETKRLILRTFTKNDLDSMTRINQDPKVMKYFPSIGNRTQTQALIERIMAHQVKYGYSLYAVELKDTHEMIGFVGLLHRTREEFNAPFMPATEIGWRLSSNYWRRGYATEAARAVLHYAFTTLNLTEVVSFTVVNNTPSRRVMEKIGLIYDPQSDFNHPKLEKNSPLSHHVLYRLPEFNS